MDQPPLNNQLDQTQSLDEIPVPIQAQTLAQFPTNN